MGDGAMEVNSFRCAVRRCRGSSESGSARAGDLAPSNWCQALTADVRRCEKTRTGTVRSKLHHLQETLQRHWNWNANAWSSQSMKTLHILCTILSSMWGRQSRQRFLFFLVQCPKAAVLAWDFRTLMSPFGGWASIMSFPKKLSWLFWMML